MHNLPRRTVRLNDENSFLKSINSETSDHDLVAIVQ